MAEIRIDAQDLISFLAKAHLDGLVLDCVVAAKNGALITKGIDTSRAIYFRIVGEARVIKEGLFPIGNLPAFMKQLTRFDGVVKVTSSDKQIVVKQRNKIGRFEITPKQNIESFSNVKAIQVKKNTVKTPSLKIKYKTNNFIVSAEQLNEIVGDADVLDEHTYYIIIDGEVIKVKVERGRNSFTTKLDNKKSNLHKNMSVCFGHGIKEVFRTLEGRVKIYIEKDPPLLIKFGDGLRSIYLVMTKEEEE